MLMIYLIIKVLSKEIFTAQLLASVECFHYGIGLEQVKMCLGQSSPNSGVA